MSVTAGLTATKAALDITKLVMDKLNRPNIDVNDVRASVQGMLIHVVNAQLALGDAQEEIRELKQTIGEFENLKVIGDDLEYVKDGGYYRRKSDEAPCCPTCWGNNQKAVAMQPMASGYYRCPIHDASFHTDVEGEMRRNAARSPWVNPRGPRW